MKYDNILKGFLALALGCVALTSCDKDEERAIVSAVSTPTLTLSASEVAIDADALDATALTLTWTKPDLGYDKVLLTYDLLISAPSSASAKTVAVSLGTSTLTKAFTAKELNALLTDSLQAEAGVASTYQLQVRAYPYTSGVSTPTGTSVAVSEGASLTATTARVLSKSLDYFFVGSMFDAGSDFSWKNGLTTFPLFLDEPKGTVYTYTGRFAAGAEFKVTSETTLGTWDGLYGLGSTAGTLSTEGSAGNIKGGATAGYYTFTFDPAGKTYTLEAYDASASTTYTSIGLIGTAVGGWDADKVTLTQASYDPHIWKATGVALVVGELKIRSNGSWDSKSWGGSSFPVAKSDTGDNIKITAQLAGTYDVVFNDLTGHYHFLKK